LRRPILDAGIGRDVVVVIDAGHGGYDVGALGQHGTREKDVALGISKQLAALINREEGMRAVLTRDGDYFIKLRERMRIAREAKADLFVSVHANGYKNGLAKGASVFILSPRGASSEAAKLLAEKENSAESIGNIELTDKDDDLKAVLIDLSQGAIIEESHDVASKVLSRMRRMGRIHMRTVQKAGFAVLKSPDVPSILVETAFITNPEEERKLRSSAHQQEYARAILDGARDYFYSNPPRGTLIAEKVRRDRSLAGLGRDYSAKPES
jgi:N-acetylmuramoyl-L-alanine amidase